MLHPTLDLPVKVTRAAFTAAPAAGRRHGAFRSVLRRRRRPPEAPGRWWPPGRRGAPPRQERSGSTPEHLSTGWRSWRSRQPDSPGPSAADRRRSVGGATAIPGGRESSPLFQATRAARSQGRRSRGGGGQAGSAPRPPPYPGIARPRPKEPDETRNPFRQLHPARRDRGTGFDPGRHGTRRRGGWLFTLHPDGPLVPDGGAGHGAGSDARGLYVTRLPGRTHRDDDPRSAGHRGHLPPPGTPGQDGHHPRRAVGRPRPAGHWRRLVRTGAQGARGPVSSVERAVRTPGGDPPDLPPDVERRRRALRRAVLPVGGDDLVSTAAPATEAEDPGGRQRRAQDPAPGGPVRRRLQPLRHRSGRGGPQDRGAQP